MASFQPKLAEADLVSNKAKRPRRRGACYPCRTAKTKCDGERPCGSCRNEVSRRKPCEYPQKLQFPFNLPNSPSVNSIDSSRVELSPAVPEGEHQVAEASSQPLKPNASSVPADCKIHKRLSLHHAVDEFIEVSPTIGWKRDRIDRIQNLWSELKTSTKNGLTGTTPVNDREDSPYDLADYVEVSDIQMLPRLNEQDSTDGRIGYWEAYVRKIQQRINQGRLMEAWMSATIAMRGLETIDIEHGSTICEETDLQPRMTSQCLRLIELECMLSFLAGGGSQLPSWSQGRFLSSKIAQQKRHDLLFADKIDLHNEIQSVLQIDISHEEGLCKFLEFVGRLGCIEHPATDLEKVSITTTEKDSIGKHELKLLADLFLVMLYCRTAAVCAYYATGRPHAPIESLSSVIHRLNLVSSQQRNKECHLVVKHAVSMLDNFEVMCARDPKNTAGSYFRVYAVLIAAVVVTVAEVRCKSRDREKIETQLCRVRQCFENLKSQDGSCPLVERGSTIFQWCLVGQVLPSPPVRRRGTGRRSSKCRKVSSPQDQNRAGSEETPLYKLESGRSILHHSQHDSGEIRRDRRSKSAKSMRAATGTPSERTTTCEVTTNDESCDTVVSNRDNPVHDDATPEQATVLHLPIKTDTDTNINGSFISDIDMSTIQSQITIDLYHTNGLVPFHPLPGFTPRIVPIRPPFAMWLAQYARTDQVDDTILFGNHSQQQGYYDPTLVWTYQPQSLMPMADSFCGGSSGLTEETTDTMMPFEENVAAPLPTEANFNLDGTEEVNMHVP